MASPRLTIIAGPNGSGKSTLADQLTTRHGLTILNPDVLCRSRLDADGLGKYESISLEVQSRYFVAAANDTAAELDRQLALPNAEIGIETVLSTTKYLPTVERVSGVGGTVTLIYVILDSPDRCVARVGVRASEGGHPVPEEKIRRRYERSVQTLPKFARLADRFFLFDNSDENPERPPQLVASTAADGSVETHTTPTGIFARIFNNIDR